MLGLKRGASRSAVSGASCSFLEVVKRLECCQGCRGRFIPKLKRALLQLMASRSWKATVLPGDQGHEYIPHMACRSATPSTGMSDSWAMICFSHCSEVLKEDHKVITLPELMKWPHYITYATSRKTRDKLNACEICKVLSHYLQSFPRSSAVE